jgi:hypothetical protein
MGLPNNALQVALFALLSADGDLTSLGVTGIFDRVPQEQTFPYVRIGKASFDENGTKTDDGWQVDFEVHALSREPGFKQAQAIQNAVYDALHKNDTFAVDGFQVIDIQHAFSDCDTEPDGVTQHGISKYRIYLSSIEA